MAGLSSIPERYRTAHPVGGGAPLIRTRKEDLVETSSSTFFMHSILTLCFTSALLKAFFPKQGLWTGHFSALSYGVLHVASKDRRNRKRKTNKKAVDAA
jgi:hypothetical protein